MGGLGGFAPQSSFFNNYIIDQFATQGYGFSLEVISIQECMAFNRDISISPHPDYGILPEIGLDYLL